MLACSALLLFLLSATPFILGEKTSSSEPLAVSKPRIITNNDNDPQNLPPPPTPSAPGTGTPVNQKNGSDGPSLGGSLLDGILQILGPPASAPEGPPSLAPPVKSMSLGTTEPLGLVPSPVVVPPSSPKKGAKGRGRLLPKVILSNSKEQSEEVPDEDVM
jgi:hypothetical protein